MFFFFLPIIDFVLSRETDLRGEHRFYVTGTCILNNKIPFLAIVFFNVTEERGASRVEIDTGNQICSGTNTAINTGQIALVTTDIT